MAMNEIGAMIDDLKKQGDYAIEKWSKQNGINELWLK